MRFLRASSAAWSWSESVVVPARQTETSPATTGRLDRLDATYTASMASTPPPAKIRAGAGRRPPPRARRPRGGPPGSWTSTTLIQTLAGHFEPVRVDGEDYRASLPVRAGSLRSRLASLPRQGEAVRAGMRGAGRPTWLRRTRDAVGLLDHCSAVRDHRDYDDGCPDAMGPLSAPVPQRSVHGWGSEATRAR